MIADLEAWDARSRAAMAGKQTNTISNVPATEKSS